MGGRTFARRLLALGLLTLAPAGAGCGGSSAPPNCGQEQPCGGDVVGAWSFLGACQNVKAASTDVMGVCPGASITSANTSLTGSLTFNSDLTYTASNWHETFTLTETVPLSCTDGTACADGNGTSTDTNNGMTVSVTVNCTGTTVCNCRLSGTLSLTSDTGTYALSGTTLQMTGAATSGGFPYCVEENRLHLMQLSTTMTTPMGQAVITSDIVAQKP